MTSARGGEKSVFSFKKILPWVVCLAVFSGSVFGLTYNHLKMFSFVKDDTFVKGGTFVKGDALPVRVPAEDGGGRTFKNLMENLKRGDAVKDFDSAVNRGVFTRGGILRGDFSLEDLENLLQIVCRLKSERDEAVFFIRKIVSAANERDPGDSFFEQDVFPVNLFDFVPEKFRGLPFFIDDGVDKNISSMYDKLLARYDILFRALGDELGVERVCDIGGALFALKHEWVESRDVLIKLTEVIEKGPYRFLSSG